MVNYVTETEYVDTSDGLWYLEESCYNVVADYDEGVSGYSNTACVTPQLNSPGSLSAQGTGSFITIEWGSTPENDQPSYNIYRVDLLLDNTGEEIIGIREGEKLNEILINSDEVRYSWEYEDMYMILNPSVHTHSPSLHEFSSKKKISNMTEYSSDTVEKIPKDEMKKIILNSGLLD